MTGRRVPHDELLAVAVTVGAFVGARGFTSPFVFLWMIRSAIGKLLADTTTFKLP